MKKIIETERLILRPFIEEDAHASLEMNSDPETMRFLGGVSDMTVTEMLASLKNSVFADYEKYGFGRFAVIHKETNQFIGFSGLKYIIELDEVDIGYRLKSDYWRKGFGYESNLPCLDFAFNELGLDRLICMADTKNDASISLMKKLGFTYEKVIHIYDCDADYYKLDKSDWLKTNG